MTDDRPPLFAALDVGDTVDVRGDTWPTVVIDASDAPEVADLARVHAVEGIGDVRTTGRRIRSDTEDLFLLGISLTTPVRAAFAIRFDLSTHHAFLHGVAERGRLVVATTDPRTAATDAPLWLSVDIDGSALRAALGA